MLLIDEGADIKLAAELETLRDDPKTARCIHFNLMGKTIGAGLKEKVIESATKTLASVDTKMFLCEDGDIFILAPTINFKDGKLFVLEVGAYCNLPVTDEWVGFYEVALHITKLQAAVEKKIEKRRAAEMFRQKLLEQQQQERKRQTILNGGAQNTSEDIKSRRTNRSAPELMLIEDDSFSRKLVENVLQKKYALTGLGTATHALETYGRIAPDILFLDIHLPDVTGHELLEKILKMDPSAYVVMLSGNADQANIVQAMSKGAKGFIAKPFTRDKLFEYIDRCPTIQHPKGKNYA